MVHDTESYANIGGIVSTLDGFKAYVDSPMYESYDDVKKDDNYLCIHLDGEDSLGEDGIIKLCQKHRDDNVTKLFFRMNGDYEYLYGMILYDQHKESYFRSENDFIRVVQSVVTELPNVTDVRFGQGGCICYDYWDDDGTPDPPHSGLPIGVMTTVLSAYSDTLIRLDASYGVHCVDVKNEKECNRFIFAFKKAKNLLYWTFPRYFDGPYEMEIMKIVESKTKKIKKKRSIGEMVPGTMRLDDDHMNKKLTVTEP
jgi:hypothetical protein